MGKIEKKKGNKETEQQKIIIKLSEPRLMVKENPTSKNDKNTTTMKKQQQQQDNTTTTNDNKEPTIKKQQQQQEPIEINNKKPNKKRLKVGQSPDTNLFLVGARKGMRVERNFTIMATLNNTTSPVNNKENAGLQRDTVNPIQGVS